MGDFFGNLWTTLKRFRTSSALNIVGLAVSFAALYVIAVQINYDVFYNHKVKDSDRIYRLEFPIAESEGLYTCSWNRVIPEECVANLASVEACGCANLKNYRCDVIVSKDGQKKRFETNGCYVTLPVLKVFDFKTVAGSISDIAKPRTVAMSKSTAERTGLSVGDSFFMDGTNPENINQVVAIYEDFPSNTDLSHAQMIFDIGENALGDLTNLSFCYFAKLSASANNDVELLTKQANESWKNFMINSGKAKEEVDAQFKKGGMRFDPIKEVYYKQDVDDRDSGNHGDKVKTYTLTAIAIIIVVIAFVNFINFFLALVPIRIKSVNTRKLFGCSALKLRSMLVFESFGLVLIGLAISAIIVKYAENTSVAQLVDAPILLGANVEVAATVVFLAFLLALIASIFPVFYITSFPASMVIKGSFGTSKAGRALRYGLVGFQFVISLVLIICAIFVNLQHKYMMTYDMGFDKTNVMTTNIYGRIPNDLQARESFDNKLKSNPNIKDVAWAGGRFVADSRMDWNRDLKEKKLSFALYAVSWNFLRFMGIKVVEGRDFEKSDEYSPTGTIIFNAETKKDYGCKIGDNLFGHACNVGITGFCSNFNFRPLKHGIEPFAFYVFGSNPWYRPQNLYVRVANNADVKEVNKAVKDAALAIDPGVETENIDLQFFDKELERNYQKEQNLSLLITLSSILAIIISLMGVFGLVMFETQYRTKEIAIRRVHGASVKQVLKMFNKKFIVIIGVCFVIAAPASYLAISSWLEDYAYKVPMYWWVPALALLAVLLVTIITVTMRSYSAATGDPAEMVKSE